ncbi:MAG: hypothetical protein OEQ16_15765, partial [Gammaproteobacteria bacterium]|nr:hypothetical protein [Gammaproteobacteria bacterium]
MRSITPLLEGGVAFTQKSWRADTQEHKVTVAGVLNALRRVFRDAYGIARANGIRWRIADEHQ